MEAKQKNFSMTTDDIQWLRSIRAKAKTDTLGNVSLSQILADLCEFARSNEYEYQVWRKH